MPSLNDTNATIARIELQLRQHGIAFRAPPPVPTSCCGRGCNGCVWEGYFAACDYWIEQATALVG